MLSLFKWCKKKERKESGKKFFNLKKTVFFSDKKMIWKKKKNLGAFTQSDTVDKIFKRIYPFYSLQRLRDWCEWIRVWECIKDRGEDAKSAFQVLKDLPCGLRPIVGSSSSEGRNWIGGGWRWPVSRYDSEVTRIRCPQTMVLKSASCKFLEWEDYPIRRDCLTGGRRGVPI